MCVYGKKFAADPCDRASFKFDRKYSSAHIRRYITRGQRRWFSKLAHSHVCTWHRQVYGRCRAKMPDTPTENEYPNLFSAFLIGKALPDRD